MRGFGEETHLRQWAFEGSSADHANSAAVATSDDFVAVGAADFEVLADTR